MTDEQIKALAQSYVEELFAHDDMQDQENIEAKNDALVMCMAFAGHILENHCIVPKELIKDTYNNFADKLTDRFHLTAQERAIVHASIASALVHIFGKDMFEEEKI